MTPPLTTPTELIVARHGEAHRNVERFIGGARGCRGLTDTDRDQVSRLARRLRREHADRAIDALCTTPLTRTRQSAALVAHALELQPVVEPDLRETDFGDADGKSWTEVIASFGRIPALEPDRPIAPGAEIRTQYLTRSTAALGDILTRHTGQRVLVVGHAETTGTAAHLFLDLPATARGRTGSPPSRQHHPLAAAAPVLDLTRRRPALDPHPPQQHEAPVRPPDSPQWDHGPASQPGTTITRADLPDQESTRSTAVGTGHPVNPWQVAAPAFQLGGRCVVRRHQAPLGLVLPYRRAAGEHPAELTGGGAAIRRHGWLVDLGERGFGNMLLGLGLVQAMADATLHTELLYTGRRPDLMRRSSLPITAHQTAGPHVIHTGNRKPVRFQANPEQPAAWLDLLDRERVEVHAALPMRYYIAAEQTLGIRLPATHGPAPTFLSSEGARPFRVVFVATTSWPDRKDYGIEGFARIARTLADRLAAPWTFCLITSPETASTSNGSTNIEFEVVAGADSTDCIDVFASAELVVGNDTGLTHLAALTQRPDGTGPQVVGIYGRHPHTKWTTGSERHHAVATSFSQMLSVADRCPVRDHLDEPLWSSAASLAALPADEIADFAGHQAGWW